VNVIQAIILGLVQGLTEFIPVSSSGHLLLFHHLFGLSEKGLGFDVALHIGTLTALVVYFHKDIVSLVKDGLFGGAKQRLAWVLVAATVPAVIAGALLQSAAEDKFRTPVLVCFTLAGMALLMIAAEKYADRQKHKIPVEKTSFKQGLAIGSAQALALVPGVSRSGSTITGGLFLGLDRVAATRFSFLLSIPITAGAILKVVSDQATINQIKGQTDLFVIGIVTAFLSGLFAIRFLLKFVAKHRLNAFAYYRLGVAAFTLLMLALF
jgi:undecaprenyl-diphosphatase